MTPWWVQPGGAAAERAAALANIANGLRAVICAARVLAAGARDARERALARAIERAAREVRRDVTRLRRRGSQGPS